MKRGDDNKLEINLRPEKVVASKQLRLGNDAATKRLRLAMKTEEERKARLEKRVATAQPMLAMIKGVVNVSMVLSLKPILKGRQPEEVVHSHNVIVFFVWVWPSGFCD